MSWTTWEPAPLVLSGAGVTLVLFAHAFARLRRRGRSDRAPWSRVALLVLAVAAGTLPLVSPLDELGDSYLLSGHMLQHVLVGDAAPALMLLALRGPLLFFVLPRTLVRRLARNHVLRRALATLLRPRVSLAAWMLVGAGWHVPAAYDFALANQTVHDLEHLSFIAAGVLVWTQVVDPARRNSLRERLGCMLAMAAFALVLGGVLIASAPLYPAYATETVRLFGIGPALDQQLAGAVMVAAQIGALAVCACCLLGAHVPAARRAIPARSATATADLAL